MSTSPSTPSGRDFASTFETTYDARTGLRQGGTTDRIRDRLVHEERIKLHRQGFEPATIINLNSFPLIVYLGDMGTVEVPPCAPEMPFARLTLNQFRLSMRDMGDGSFSPVSVLPTELAQEVEREYRDTGGVFWYRGAHEPSAEQLAEAHERQLSWYRREFQKAVDSWSRYRQYKFITDRQRDAARALFHAGELLDLPEWITLMRVPTPSANCPACGEEVKPEAKLCRYCGFQIDDQWARDNQARLGDKKSKH